MRAIRQPRTSAPPAATHDRERSHRAADRAPVATVSPAGPVGHRLGGYSITPPAATAAPVQRTAAATPAGPPLGAAAAATPVQLSKSNSQKGFERNQAKKKAKARKQLTGRNRQGNHDSNTKPNKKGPKGDKHAKGVRQSGSAGRKKNKN